MVPRHPAENGVSAAFLDELGRLLRAAADDDFGRPAALHRAAALLAERLGADSASLVTPTGDDTLRVVASSDLETVGDVVTSLERYPELQQVLAAGQPLVVPASGAGDAATESILAVPMRLPDIAAVLRLVSRRHRFDDRDLARLREVTAHLERTLAGGHDRDSQSGPWGTLATALADVVLEVAIDGRVIAVHHRRQRSLPVSRARVGDPIGDLLAHPGSTPPAAVTPLELTELASPARLDLLVLAPGTEPIPVRATVVRTDGLPPRSLIALNAADPHPGTAASAEAPTVNEARLRARLEETLDELERAQLRLAEAESSRHRFVSASAHELKTPITVARSYLEIILNDLAEGLTKEQLSFVRIAHESVLRLRRLVGDLVDLAAIDSGRIQLDIGRVEVAPLLTAVLAEQQTLAAQAGITLTLGDTEPGLAIRGSADRVEQVLRNLIDNALKFTPQGGNVSLTAAGDEDSIALAVRDTGIGIPADALGSIFGEFIQAEAPGSAQRRGAGLGLSIARRVVRALGGRITVTSERGVGSTFTVRLPRWPDEE